MSPHDPPQAFVDNFIRLLTDADVTEFQRVLEMKVYLCCTLCTMDCHIVLCVNARDCFIIQLSVLLFSASQFRDFNMWTG